MIYLISDSELRLLCAESGFSANVRSPIASFLSDGAQSEGRMLDENRRGLADLGLFEKKAARRWWRGCCTREVHEQTSQWWR